MLIDVDPGGRVRLVSKTRAWAYMENPKSSFRIHIEPPDSP